MSLIRDITQEGEGPKEERQNKFYYDYKLF